MEHFIGDDNDEQDKPYQPQSSILKGVIAAGCALVILPILYFWPSMTIAFLAGVGAAIWFS